MTSGLKARILVISLPVMFAELSETIIHVTDTALLGRVGQTELAALVLADTVLGLLLVVALGLTDALQIVVARRQGEEDPALVGRTFAHGVLLVFGTSLVLALLLKVLSPWISGMVASSPDVSAAVDEFLQIAAYGVPFLCTSFAFSAFFVGIARTVALVVATATLTVVNLVLGYGLILGNLSLPRLGIEGAAWASVGAEVVTAGVLIGYSIAAGHARRYGLFRPGGWDPRIFRKLWVLGVPVIEYGIIEALQWLAFFVIMEEVGTAALAISNVIYACLLVFLIPAEALSESAVSLVSRVLGAGSPQRVRSTAMDVQKVAALATLPIAVVAFIAPNWVLSFFFGLDAGPDAELVLRIVAASLIVGVPWIVWTGAIQGTGDTSAASFIDASVSIVVMLWAIVAVLVLHAGLVSAWIGLAVAWAAGAVASGAWMRSGRWRRVAV